MCRVLLRGDTDLDQEDDLPEMEIADPGVAMPSAFIMERSLRAMNKAVEETGIDSEEELQAFLAEYNQRETTGPQSGALPEDPKERAQEFAFQAMETQDEEEATWLARRALQLDPDCVDALATLAHETAGSEMELITLLQQAVATGERVHGPQFFEEHRGHFWGTIETRPYMRSALIWPRPFIRPVASATRSATTKPCWS